MRRHLVFAAALLLSSTGFAKPDKKTESLKAPMEKILEVAEASHANIGVEVVSLKTGEVLYEKNSKNLFVPASLLKIFTCAAALDRLGPSYQFETMVKKDSKGNLYLIGAGDPSLDESALDELAYFLSLQNEKEFADLIVDQTLFDSIVNGPGWMWDEGDYYWNSPIDALLVDHSCVDLWVLPSAIKSPPKVVFRRGGDFVSLENTAMTTEENGQLEVRRTPFARENMIEVVGSLDQNASPQLFRLPVAAPHMYAAHLFQKKLKSFGIAFKGTAHIGKTPDEAQVLATHRSLPLSVLIRAALKDSDNLTANCLFKKLGSALEGSQGTWQNGSKAVRAFLEEKVKIKLDDLVLLDGDGESRYNLVSPHHFIQCLRYISQQFSYGPEFTSALSVSGTDGRFMKNRLDQDNVRGKIRAKTGGMTGITCLAGFAETKEGEILAFAIMINGFTKKALEIRAQVEDPICQLLATFSRKPK